VARRLIGLDIGTNAVTIAEVTSGARPRLERFGQVALPRDAMHEGEVADDLAVTDAIARLRDEIELKKAPVRVGIASPRVIVRQVEMPVMTRDELASALQYQAADLIPIPIDEAVLDFAILGTEVGDDGEPMMRVLLAAAQQAMILRLVSVVEDGGLPVGAVDLVPLALIRALARPTADEPGAEGIVSFGGGVTSIAVHELGVPKFVRALGTAGRELTDAIATDLDIPAETAEALKRQLAGDGDELLVRARAAIERPLANLLDEVRSSLDYYRNQPGAARLARVVVTGGATQLPGLPERLAALVGVPVELAAPRELIDIGDIRFAENELPRLDPYLPAAVGLALGGAGVGTVIDLLPRNRRSRATTDRSRFRTGGVAAAAALLVLLAVPTILQRQSLQDEKDAQSAVEERNAELRADIAALDTVSTAHGEVDALQAQLTTLLSTDVSWSRMLQGVGKTIPDNVWLTSFQGTSVVASPTPATTPPTTPTESTGSESAPADDSATAASTAAAATPAPPAGINGQVTFEARGLDFPDVSIWLKNLGDPAQFPSLAGLWVSTAARADVESQEVVNFTSSAQLTDAARSDRLERFEQGENG
jgi:type IV pilus assembly protein PilM